MLAYFDAQDNLRDSDENRVEFATYALDELRFCYKKAPGDDPEVRVLISVYVHVNALYCSNSRDFIKALLSSRLSVHTSARFMELARYPVLMVRV